MTELTTQERFKRGAADACRYFDFMAQFVDFKPEHAEAIRATRFVVEKHIPDIVADFYTHLLSFPATRKHFQKKDGSIDQEYLQLRMQHQATFWRRTATAVFDEDYARFVDYVGRAHTSQGADPTVYIPERYVMGMVGFVQQRIGAALDAELSAVDPELAFRAMRGWNALLVVLLEQLSRVYGEGREAETYQQPQEIDERPIHQLAVETYERSLGMARSIDYREVIAGSLAEFIAEGCKIIKAEGLSIGVFFVDGKWHALQNSCLHRGGPVCEGPLENGVLTCPWHGYQYRIDTGELLLDPDARLPRYPVEVRGDQVVVQIPVLIRDHVDISMAELFAKAVAAPVAVEPAAPRQLAANEFRVVDLRPGHAVQLYVDDAAVAVYNVDGTFYATQDECTHADGPLSEGDLEGATIVCPWHASCFDIATGAVLKGPAREPLRTYSVVVDGDVGRVE
ncbi:MAG: Rieske 2Fe-2S domain-containing protein [Anaerolineae bacterium]|nr:Rieske 2Fe-2S domain-containing protein [Anaerolineae bacterium]MCO5246854.1 Rieske 2Fe-2S domain-containing protein [Anaerolineae bacterium]